MRFSFGIILAAVFLVNMSARAADIEIDLSTQTMHVEYKNGDTRTWKISSGKLGKETPTGNYTPRALLPMAISLKYDNAPMPNSIVFLGDYAIHGTDAVGHLGRAVSHGCVRLQQGNAAELFGRVKKEGASIHIFGEAPVGRATFQASDEWAPPRQHHVRHARHGVWADDEIPNVLYTDTY